MSPQSVRPPNHAAVHDELDRRCRPVTVGVRLGGSRRDRDEFLLSLATGALAFSTRNLAAKTAEEVEHSGKQVEAMQKQVAETQRQANASIKQVEATQQQVGASLKQVEATQQQSGTALEALGAAREQTRISQLTLDAQIRPVLIDVPPNEEINEPAEFPGRGVHVNNVQGAVLVWAPNGQGEVLISLPFRNAGAGLAMIRDVVLRFRTEIERPPMMISPANVPPRELGRISFRATPGDAAFEPLAPRVEAHEGFSIEVGYLDLAGQQRAVSRFDVYFHPRASWEWEVRQVDLQTPRGDEPFTP